MKTYDSSRGVGCRLSEGMDPGCLKMMPPGSYGA